MVKVEIFLVLRQVWNMFKLFSLAHQQSRQLCSSPCHLKGGIRKECETCEILLAKRPRLWFRLWRKLGFEELTWGSFDKESVFRNLQILSQFNDNQNVNFQLISLAIIIFSVQSLRCSWMSVVLSQFVSFKILFNSLKIFHFAINFELLFHT